MNRLTPKSFSLPLAGAFCVWAGAASADVAACLPYDTLASRLTAYGEAPVGSFETAEAPDAPRQELWASPVTGTWTLLEIDGATACMRTHGKRWRFGGMGIPA